MAGRKCVIEKQLAARRRRSCGGEAVAPTLYIDVTGGTIPNGQD